MKIFVSLCDIWFFRSIGARYSAVSGEDCPCLGPLQAVFVLLACSKPRTDTAGLIANKLEAAALSKFAHRVQGLMAEGLPENALFRDSAKSYRISRVGQRKTHTPDAIPAPDSPTIPHPALEDGRQAAKPNSSNRNKRKKNELSNKKNQTKVTAPQVVQPQAPPVFALLEELKSRRLFLPANKAKVTQTDLDIYFNKCRSDPNSGNTLSYSDFVQLLTLCAKQVFSVVEEKSKAPKSNILPQPKLVQVVGESDNDSITIASSANVPKEKARPSATNSSSSNKKTAVSSSSTTKSARRRINLTLEKLSSPVTECLTEGIIVGKNGHGFSFNTPDFLLVLIVKLFVSFVEDPAMVPILRWLELESKARISYFVIKIQTRYRMKKAGFVRKILAKKHEEKMKTLRNAKFAVKIQCCARKYLSRKRTITLAQKLILKYVPLSGAPYWYHTRTKVSYTKKPKILRDKER